MAKIVMLKDAHGSPNHIQVILYKENQEYDVPDTLAKAFVEDMKVAVPAGGRRPQPEAKMKSPVEENKSAAPAAEKKEDSAAPAADEKPKAGRSGRQ